MDAFVGSLDQGTTSTRFLIFNRDGEPVASHQVEFAQIYPQPGWHEHDPLELISSAETCISEAVRQFELAGHAPSSIRAIGITNQRETTVVWDHETGEPLHNAIVWTDTRSQDIVSSWKQKPGASTLQHTCGLPLSTYASASKLLWLLAHCPKVQDAYARGTLAFGTVDAWLVYRLNGGPNASSSSNSSPNSKASGGIFVTDPTNASRTMFLNLHTLQYDPDLLSFFGLHRGRIHLPTVVPSSDSTAYGALASGPLAGVRITACLGDQSAALVGQKAFSPGMAKNTYGTGCFLLCNVGEKPVISRYGLLATVAYQMAGQRAMYALEGSIAVGGSGVKFLQENMGFFEDADGVNGLAGTVEDNGGVVFVTAFSGLYAPYWIDDARGTIFGLTQYSQKGHIARATLEATCFQTKAILSAMEKDSGQKLSELAVDGGMSNSDLTMQTQANQLSIPVYRPKMRETTALGAAMAAGLAANVWRNLAELRDLNRAGGTVFEPKTDEASVDESRRLFERWERAVGMCRGWCGGKGNIDREREREGSAAAVLGAGEKNKTKKDVKMRLEIEVESQLELELDDADEEDLYLELRRVEILRRLKRKRREKEK